MKVSVLRRRALEKPFRPFEMRLQNGDRYAIEHPEQIFVTNDFVAWADPEGAGTFVAPEAVVSIATLKNGRRA
jgi:hypothetical protein